MSTNQSSISAGEAVFRSEWLRALIRAEQFTLPPPLPSLPGAITVSEHAASSIDRGEGFQLSRYYFQRIEKSAEQLANRREGQIIGVNINHYLRYSRSRLTRIFDVLEPRQRTYFALIPYLLNANAPGIPGYQANQRVAHGIYDCDFNPTVMRAVEQTFGHRQKHSSRQNPAITTMFCETSLGTMSQNETARFDLWLILRAGLSQQEAQVMLESKLSDVKDWLGNKNIQVEFHLIDFDGMEENPTDAYKSTYRVNGLSQSILRERLYRDCIFLCGQIPLWWAAPAGIKKENYGKLVNGVRKTADKLAQSAGWVVDTKEGRTLQCFLNDKGDYLSLVNLGFLADPSHQELINFAFEQLTQSLFNPFEGCIHMALSYARIEGVPFSYVCDRLKKSVSSGEYELEHTDLRFIYIDVLNHQFREGKDRYFQRLFRVCIYLSLGVISSRKRNQSREYEVMRSYCKQWGWNESLITELDEFQQWSVEKVDLLARSVRTLLLDLYRRLSRFVQQNKIGINSREDIIRRRRLSACFEGMLGKVPHLFTYFLNQAPKEEHLTFVERPQAATQAQWELYREGELSSHLPLFSGESLSQLASWAVFNGLFHPHTIVNIVSTRPEYNIIETRTMLHKMYDILNYSSAAELRDETFIDPPKVKRLIITVSPTSFHEESSNSYAAHGWDILNYGQQKRSQLTDISVIMQNSWGELFCRRYQGETAFTDAMKSLFAEGGARIDLEHEPEVLGPNDRVQPIVRKRIQEILNQATEVYQYQGESTKIFAYEVGGQFQVLYRGPDGAKMNTVRSLRGVIRRCGKMTPFDQDLLIDQLSPSLREVRALVKRFQEDDDAKIYVGWKQQERLGYVIMCDERQRLFCQQSSARETRLAVMRVVRRVLPYLRKKVSNPRELSKALRIFEFNEGQVMGGRGPVFTEATGPVLSALSKSYIGKNGLWLVGNFYEGRNGIGLQYGKERFMASRYGSSFVYACVKHIVEEEGLQDPELWTLDGSKVNFGPKYPDGVGAVQHLRLVATYQKEITKALNFILQNQFAEAQ
jgi:adenylate cyclase